jgi:putative ABC transport system permease protein
VTGVWWSDAMDEQTAYRNPRFQTLVLGTFAGLALGLTALGVFGVVTSAVARRMREMAVRLAVGAPPRSLIVLVLRQLLPPLIAGIVIGLAATQGLRRIAESQLYEVNARDPLILSAAVFTVCLAAVVAAYLPARFAGRVDPVVALRCD